MTPSTFRIKPYAHPKYKFVVRAKLKGKWKRSYFRNQEDAIAYARDQNVAVEKRQQRGRGDNSRSDAGLRTPRAKKFVAAPTKRLAVPATGTARKAVVILGMHRSGTSALGGALQLLGVDFGRRLAPPGNDNEKGYWEHPDIVALHDELLRSLGSRWDDDKPLPADWIKRDITRDIRSLLIGILERDFADNSLFGMKDPRICRLMPLWFAIFQTLRVEPHFILIVRHPWEVAESLAKRDGIEHPRSYLLWLEHVVQAESATRSHERSFVCYDEMIDNPVAILGQLRKQLGVNLRDPSQVGTSLRNFLDPALRHHQLNKKKADKPKQPLPQLALDFYETIRKASTPHEIEKRIAPLAAQFIRGREVFYPRIDLMEAELASLDKEIEKSEETGLTGGNLVRLEVFHPMGEGYRAAESQARYFPTRSWKLLSIDLPGRQADSERPIRIDPVTYPAVIDIAEIALKRPTTSETVWSAAKKLEFDAIEVGGTACRLAHESNLRILSFGTDPQLILPPSTSALASSPLRLELSILVDASPKAMSASLAEIHEKPPTETLTPAALTVLHADQGDGYTEAVSLAAPLEMDVLQTIRFEHLEKFYTDTRTRLRIDPIDRAAFLVLYGIRIIRSRDDFVLYAAQSASEFKKMAFSDGLLNYEEGEHLVLLATEPDPQIFLPVLENLGQDACRIEITLEPQRAPRSIILRHAQVLKERAEVAPKLKETQFQLARLEAASGAWERTFAELKGPLEKSYQDLGRVTSEIEGKAARISELEHAIEEARAESARLLSELETDRSQNRQIQIQVDDYVRQIATLDAEIRNLQDTAEQARTKSDRLASEVDLERAQNGAHQARAQEYTRQITALDAALQGAIEQGRANSTQLLAELEGERAQKQEQQARAEDYAKQVTALDSEVRSLHAAVEQAQSNSNQLSTELETERARTLDYEGRLRNAENQRGLLERELQEERNVFAAEVRNVEKAIGETRALAIEVAAALESERSRNRQHQAEAERDNQQIASLTGEINALRSGIKQARAESAQLSSKLQKTTGLLESSAARALHLSGVLEIRKSHSSGLQFYTARLEHRLDDVSQKMRAAAEALKQGDPDAPAIVNLISEDIHRIHDPSFCWKMAKALGILRFAHTGVPRTAEERRALARQLRAGLREICRTLSFTTTTPEEAAAEISRLFKLRRQARAILQSLKLSSLFGLKSPKWHIVHWARQTATNLSGIMPASALFDAAWYLGRYPDVAASDVDPLRHYLRWGAREGRDPNPVFNSAWYLEKNPDVAAAEINPLKHYWDFGAREGRDPSPYFSTTWYLAKNPDIAAAGLNPLQHYLAHGAREGRDPHPLFNSTWYLSQNPEVVGLNPLEHYLHWGSSHDLRPHPLVNSK